MSSGAGFSSDENAPFFGFLGAVAALVFSFMGAVYGTAKSGVGVASLGVMRSNLVMLVLGMKCSRSGDKCLIQICWSSVVFVDM
ncbi:hypothetical protein Hanom_Chr12g01174541 [Helianthus anomalus]